MKTFTNMIAAAMLTTMGFTGIAYSADLGERRGRRNFTLDFN